MRAPHTTRGAMKPTILAVALTAIAASLSAHGADANRQADVARRGADVMPFSLAATQHMFTKTPDGGVQRVVARRASDAPQVKLVRQHLREISKDFAQGRFDAPEHIHGHEMPGLAALRSAKPGEIRIAYRDVPAGAELTYRTADPALVAALHEWFDAQVADHGHDAMAGHDHRDMHLHGH